MVAGQDILSGHVLDLFPPVEPAPTNHHWPELNIPPVGKLDEIENLIPEKIHSMHWAVLW